MGTTALVTWQSLPLIEVATLQRGYDLPVQDRRPGGIPIFAANGPVGMHSEAQCDGPGVVTGRSGTIGKVHYSSGSYWPLNTSLYVKDFHGNHPRFIYWLLSGLNLERFHEGSGVPTLNRNNVHGVKVPVPPLPEQRRIADILDRADALRAKRRAALARLDELKLAIFIEMFGDSERNPMGWSIKPMQEVVRPDTIITYGIVQAGDEFPGGIPYIRTGDIKEGEILVEDLRRTNPEIAAKFQRSRVETGDIVMSIRATVGTTALVPPEINGANLTQGTAKICPGPSTNRIFLLSYLRSQTAQQWILRQVKGATFREITLRRLRELPVPVPPFELQLKFANRLSQVTSIVAMQRRTAEQSDLLFASLQDRAFRGAL